jgi:hypothetical protein
LSCLTTKQFCNCLAYQLWHYPFPNIVTPGRYVPWFETIPGRFNPSNASSTANSSLNLSIDSSSVSEFKDPLLCDGWTVKVPKKHVKKPTGAPGLPIDLLLTHQQQKIWFGKEKKLHRSARYARSMDSSRRGPPSSASSVVTSIAMILSRVSAGASGHTCGKNF